MPAENREPPTAPLAATDVDSAVVARDAPPHGPRAPDRVMVDAAPDNASCACLVVFAAPNEARLLGRRFNLGSVIRIGSAGDNDVVLGGEQAAAHHARIERRDGTYQIVVEAGAGPALLGETTVLHEAPLVNRDRVRIGRVALELLEAAGAAALDEAYFECIYRVTLVDGATGAYNRRYLYEALENEMKRARRYSRCLSLALFAVDDLARARESIGALFADQALRRVVGRVSALSAGEITARVGDHEMAVIMLDASPELARERADEIVRIIGAAPVETEAGQVRLTARGGVATLEDGDRSAGSLEARARARLDAAKQGT